MLPQNGWNVVDISLGNRPRERNVYFFAPNGPTKSHPNPNKINMKQNHQYPYSAILYIYIYYIYTVYIIFQL